MEKKEMMEKWKNTERQGELARQFPSLILKQAKKVWQWAVELKDGRQWLPSKARQLKGQERDTRCQNCLLGEADDLQHIFRCPALLEHHNQIIQMLKSQLAGIGLPFYSRNVRPDKEVKTHRLIRTAIEKRPLLP